MGQPGRGRAYGHPDGGGVIFALFVAVLIYIPRLIRDGIGEFLLGSLFF